MKSPNSFIINGDPLNKFRLINFHSCKRLYLWTFHSVGDKQYYCLPVIYLVPRQYGVWINDDNFRKNRYYGHKRYRTPCPEFLLIVLFKVFQTNRQFERFDRNVTISTSSFQSNRFINLLQKIKGSHHIDLVRPNSTFLLSTMRIYAH